MKTTLNTETKKQESLDNNGFPKLPSFTSKELMTVSKVNKIREDIPEY